MRGIIKRQATAQLSRSYNFVTVKDGQQNWRKEKIKPADLRELQTAVAEMLQMERDKENSEAERLSHKQYKRQRSKKSSWREKF